MHEWFRVQQICKAEGRILTIQEKIYAMGSSVLPAPDIYADKKRPRKCEVSFVMSERQVRFLPSGRSWLLFFDTAVKIN